MEFDKSEVLPMKRHSNDPGKNERPCKKATHPRNVVEIDDDSSSGEVFKFRVLLPNGLSLDFSIREPKSTQMPLKELVEIIKDGYYRISSQTEHVKQNQKRNIKWNSGNLCVFDDNDNVIQRGISFQSLMPNKVHLIRLCDGSEEAVTYEDMWDLTPDTDLLMELPKEYTFETALADLIDNSLQAVWSNGVEERRIVSVEISEEKISIFDSGPGMDSSEKNSIVKWGKMGASMNRLSKVDGVGGKPPYLTPFFGMFGFGGSKASMHLGRYALVSSKTKESKKVYMLHLQREALLSKSGSEKSWRTGGGIRDPTDDEIRESPHGSFTKVEIFHPKVESLDVLHLQNRLKDIYFPYIQCDELSKTKTITPVEFEVNGTNLTEIEGGEVAITNLQSCNGPDFILQLHFSQNVPETSGKRARGSQKAHARLKFVYFPVVESKESIDIILEKLKEGYEIKEDFDTFSRVSIRRLGRLLPDARWISLPFMIPKQQRGHKAHRLKRCSRRVKCFIDTDAGFNPTPSKTALAHHDLYATALKNFGEKPPEDVNVDIYKNGKEVELFQLEKQYHEWILKMHEQYDKEVECGDDQPVVVLRPQNAKKLGISSEVLSVHKVFPRKGSSWKSGQKIKILKGACAGCHKNNVYATLEYILLEGFSGDAGGEARLICRPISVPEEKGCKLTWNDDGTTNIDIGNSLSLPVGIIDHDQCLAVNNADWEKQVERQSLKQPSSVDILSASDCLELGIDGALPCDSTVYAGHAPPKNIVAVVRPGSFYSASSSKSLDQKNIIRDNFEIGLKIKYNNSCKSTRDDYIYSGFITQSSHNGNHGLYVFPLDRKFPDIFKKTGVYTFSLSLRGSTVGSFERKIKVKPLSEVSSWDVLTDERTPPLLSARVGSCFPPISIACYDAYKNRIAFPSAPQIIIEVVSGNTIVSVINNTKLDLSSDKLTLTIKDMLVKSNKLDHIRPSNKCTLLFTSEDGELSTSIPCQVLPGVLECISLHPKNLDKKLIPGHTIDEILLEMLDGSGNHVEKGLEISLKVDGLCLVDHIGATRKIDDRGFVDLSGILKVTGGYGTKVSLSVFLGEEIFFKKIFDTEIRELRIASTVPECCVAGSKLENMVFEVTNSNGDVDESFHDDEKYGHSHTLAVKSDSLDEDDSVKYSFRHGSCTVRAISLPQNEGIAGFVVVHSRYPELCVTFKVNVIPAPNLEPEINALQNSCEQSLTLLQNSPAFLTPKLKNKNSCSQFSGGNLLVGPDPTSLRYAQGRIIEVKSQMLMGSVIKLGESIAKHEKELKELNLRRKALEKDISMIQDSLGLVSVDDSGCTLCKEEISELIEKKKESAASVICKVLRGGISESTQQNFSGDILGVVALLGTVENYDLSRILAEYLGEDHMLGVVCKSNSAVETLEQYDENGNVDHSLSLHAIAASTGVSISGRYLVISLEDTSPYVGNIGNNPQRKLELPDPFLPSGITPPGYIGYAVNLIHLDDDHLFVKTGTGHGLRETLFYRLFGELQVYDTRENMKKARSCIKYGAVSLDGGIMRDGVLSLGNRQSKICFPLIPVVTETSLSTNNTEIKKLLKDKKMELRLTISEIKEHDELYQTTKKKYNKSIEKSGKFMKLAENARNLFNKDLLGP